MDGTLSGGTYEIVINATLGTRWAQSFEGFEMEHSHDTTVLRGNVADQSELHGILARLRDLAIPLVEIRQIQDGAAETGK